MTAGGESVAGFGIQQPQLVVNSVNPGYNGAVAGYGGGYLGRRKKRDAVQSKGEKGRLTRKLNKNIAKKSEISKARTLKKSEKANKLKSVEKRVESRKLQRIKTRKDGRKDENKQNKLVKKKEKRTKNRKRKRKLSTPVEESFLGKSVPKRSMFEFKQKFAAGKIRTKNLLEFKFLRNLDFPFAKTGRLKKDFRFV